MTYLLAVAVFGVAAVFWLWLRDTRIFARTKLPGYRKAAYRGVVWSALALVGLVVAQAALEILGLGIILLALFLQGRDIREKVWTDERALDRALGTVKTRGR